MLIPAGGSGQPQTVSGYGITAAVPSGWHARVLRGAVQASTAQLASSNRSLGRAMSRRLHRGDLGVLLFEAAPVWNVPFDRSFYRSGPPRSFSAHDFRPSSVGGSNPGAHSFATRNFMVEGRYFDLFVESGSARAASVRLAQLDKLIGSLRIRPGDFYPGEAPPARFRRAPGWFTTSSGTVPVGPSTYSVTLASTLRYRDALNQFPPHRTLDRLRAKGIVIRLSLTADNRIPPTIRQGDRGRPVLRVDDSRCGSFEGAPATALTCRVEAWRPRRYHIHGWVIFGRTHPSPSQVGRARAELDQLLLPTWPSWPVGR